MIHRRNPSDVRLRRAERAGDLAARARELARQGRWRDLSTSELLEQQLVTQDRIELAYEVRDSDWSDWLFRSGLIQQAAGLLGRPLPARLAADYASRLPQGPEGRQAIRAARRWADDPTKHNLRAVRGAYGAAYSTAAVAFATAVDADDAADYAAVDAVDADGVADYFAADYYAASAGASAAAAAIAAADYYAASAAARTRTDTDTVYVGPVATAATAAAASAATAAGLAADAAAATAYEAAYTSAAAYADLDADAAAAAAAEYNWQKWRLARYLVAPEFPTPIPVEPL